VHINFQRSLISIFLKDKNYIKSFMFVKSFLIYLFKSNLFSKKQYTQKKIFVKSKITFLLFLLPQRISLYLQLHQE